MLLSNEDSTTNVQDWQDGGNSFYAALARTATRAIALYFSRPVRLFRPSKVSGWHSLRGHASKHGAALDPQYIRSLIRRQGFMVIPKHFVPPMVANALLGTVLWTTYTECSSRIEPYLQNHPTCVVAFSGAAAGGMQALIAAPVENARLLIEDGTGRGWSHAWKEVFRGTEPVNPTNRTDQIRDMRQVRLWMRDVGEMAGRGWTGWGWGCGKDVCGFAAFFIIFETTRNFAIRIKNETQATLQRLRCTDERRYNRHLPRLAHAVTLVGGGALAGLTYEVLCRPWDVARRVVQLEKTLPSHSRNKPSPFPALLRKAKEDGIMGFFRDHSAVLHDPLEFRSKSRRRIASALRTLARVGPWGVGFLVWEAFGPGLA
ncbi:mitochondrial carrier domain-containing protein [Phlebopus sp. FC_14]|nr:mitochondrial carrier domain-containing protein [Phlebopus sp. FC_14]